MKTAFIASLATAAIVSAACSDGDGNVLGSKQSSDSTSDSSAALTVTPAADTVMVGDTVRFMAATPDSQPVSWAVSDSAVARIEGQVGFSVLLRALRDGATTVTATSGGRTGSAQLVVMEPVPVASVTVSPPADTVAAGDSASFIATPRDAQGNLLSRPSVTWIVSDSSIARLEHTAGQSAQLRALRQGTTTVTATSEGKSGSARLVVTAPAPVASVTVTPPADTLVAGQDSVFFHATLRDAAGEVLSGRVVTWTVSDSSVIRIQYASGQSVVIRALKAGSAILTATAEGKSGSADVLVSAPPPVASVTVTPSTDTMMVGDTARFQVALRDAQGNPLYGRAVSLTLSDSTVARIDTAWSDNWPLVRALKPGSTFLTATSEGKSGSAQIVVIAPAPVASVTVTPPADTLVVGDSASFAATLRDAQGDPLSGRSVTWTVSDPSVAHIDFAAGEAAVISALQAGSAVLTATSEGKSGSAEVVVTAPAPVATVTIVPESATLAVGDSAWFRADLRDSAGNLLANRTVSWSVTDSTVIALHAYGAQALVQPRSSGSAVLRATSEGQSGEASILVR